MRKRFMVLVVAVLVIWYLCAAFISEFLFTSRATSEAIFDLLMANRGKFAIPAQPTVDTLVVATNLAGDVLALVFAFVIGYLLYRLWVVEKKVPGSK